MGKDELAQGKMKDIDWQYDPKSCKFDSDEGMVWEEDKRPVMKWVL